MEQVFEEVDPIGEGLQRKLELKRQMSESESSKWNEVIKSQE